MWSAQLDLDLAQNRADAEARKIQLGPRHRGSWKRLEELKKKVEELQIKAQAARRAFHQYQTRAFNKDNRRQPAGHRR